VGVAYFAPYGVGLGHASRLVLVADKLREGGTDIMFSSYGEAASYLSLRGYKCATVASVEFAWSMEGGFSIKNSLANIPSWFVNFLKQVNQEMRNMTSCKPEVVVSDSRLSPLVAARLLKIPSVVVLNQVKLLLSPRLRELAVSRLFENMAGEFLGSMWTLADRILVPDLPPPYTIAAHNVWQVGSAAKKLEYVGFVSPKPHLSNGQLDRVARQLGFDRSRPIVYIHVSGPSQTRRALISVALEAVKKLDSKIQFVISEGNPKGESEPKQLSESGWYYGWCPVRDEVFAMSDLVVLRGGHAALSQAIQFGKPVVSVPIENHGEQLGNSAKIAELGMGVMPHPKRISPKQLAETISQVLGNPNYKKKAIELQTIAEKLDGIDNIAQIVMSYL
jgi:UDP-N-acetylglucosamine--N-acetylmuramyl-(pentapeptide) pyrophosphoryl-undecaprenol N-acetylglucosamine transferase